MKMKGYKNEERQMDSSKLYFAQKLLNQFTSSFGQRFDVARSNSNEQLR